MITVLVVCLCVSRQTDTEKRADRKTARRRRDEKAKGREGPLGNEAWGSRDIYPSHPGTLKRSYFPIPSIYEAIKSFYPDAFSITPWHR
jgi:hypothetical protein